MLKIFCDGGARGNPGPAAFGFVVKKENQTIKEGSGYIGNCTNNIAEYTAIIKALNWLKENHKGKDLQFFLDSQLAASQLSGIYRVKNANIRNHLVKIRQLENEFGQISYNHISREENKEADRLVNEALDQMTSKSEARNPKSETNSNV